MKCPSCDNGTMIASHVSYADGTGAFNVPMKCTDCHGTGEVDDRYPEWRRVGRQMRDRRVNGQPYRSLHEEAKRRGIGVVELSRMERGLIEPIPERGPAP